MKSSSALMGGLFILVIGGVFGFMLSSSPKEAEVPEIATKTFSDEKIGVSFTYPAEWEGQVVKNDSQAAIFVKKDCTTGCNNLYVSKVTAKTEAELYTNTLGGEFKIKEYADKMNETAKEFYKANANSYTEPSDKTDFVAISGLQPNTKTAVLKIYNKKDTVFVFEIKTPADETGTPNFVLLTGDSGDLISQSEKIFALIKNSFKNISAPAGQTTDIFPAALNSGAEFKFTSCDDLPAYESQPFYADFAAKVATLDLYTTPQAVSNVGFKKATVENVIGACHSEEGKIFIAIVSPKEYCEMGNVVKYDITTQKLEYAENSRAQVPCISLESFGKRTGTVIEVKGAHGDAGSVSTAVFEYGYNQNVLQVKQVCSGTAGEGELECKNY